MNAACCHANCQAHSMFLRVSSSRAIVSRGRISRRSAFEIRAGSSTKNTHILPIRTNFCAWVCRPYVGVSPQKYDVSPCVAIFFCPSGSEFHASRRRADSEGVLLPCRAAARPDQRQGLIFRLLSRSNVILHFGPEEAAQNSGREGE